MAPCHGVTNAVGQNGLPLVESAEPSVPTGHLEALTCVIGMRGSLLCKSTILLNEMVLFGQQVITRQLRLGYICPRYVDHTS